jgi:hypothetical protein
MKRNEAARGVTGKGPDMPDGLREEDVIWIQDAAKEYNVDRKALDRLIDEGKLSVVATGVSRRVYLVRAELDRLFGYHIVKPATDESAAG